MQRRGSVIVEAVSVLALGVVALQLGRVLSDASSMHTLIITQLGALLTLLIAKIFEMFQEHQKRKWEREMLLDARAHRNRLEEKTDCSAELTAMALAVQVEQNGRTLEELIENNRKVFEEALTRYRSVG